VDGAFTVLATFLGEPAVALIHILYLRLVMHRKHLLRREGGPAAGLRPGAAATLAVRAVGKRRADCLHPRVAAAVLDLRAH